MLSATTVAKILQRVRIEEIAAIYTSLRDLGVRYEGTCPFHNGDKGTLRIYPDKQIFHCTVCGKKGAAIQFIMDIEHINRDEALRQIATFYNIEIEEVEDNDDTNDEASIAQSNNDKETTNNSDDKENNNNSDNADISGNHNNDSPDHQLINDTLIITHTNDNLDNEGNNIVSDNEVTNNVANSDTASNNVGSEGANSDTASNNVGSEGANNDKAIEQKTTVERKLKRKHNAPTQQEKLYQLHRHYQEWLTNCLYNTEEGRDVALTYLKDARGFSDDIIRAFGLGYAVEEPQDAYFKEAQHLFNVTDITNSGICYLDYHGSGRDRFGGRVMFPVYSVAGRIIAFSGRIMTKSDNKAKYINSPESPIYTKGREIYGLFQARQSIEESQYAILVEGNADVVSMHQNGFTNVVASLGTALKDYQASLLHRFTDNIIILYDGDSAGIHAAIKAFKILLKEGMRVHAVLLPNGEDPDSYVRNNSRDAMNDYINSHKASVVRFHQQLLENEGFDIEKTANTIKEIEEVISSVEDKVFCNELIHECSTLFKIKEKIIREDIKRIRLLNKEKEANARIFGKIGQEIPPQTAYLPPIPENIPPIEGYSQQFNENIPPIDGNPQQFNENVPPIEGNSQQFNENVPPIELLPTSAVATSMESVSMPSDIPPIEVPPADIMTPQEFLDLPPYGQGLPPLTDDVPLSSVTNPITAINGASNEPQQSSATQTIKTGTTYPYDRFERNIFRLLVMYGGIVVFEEEDGTSSNVANGIALTLKENEMVLHNPVFQKMLDSYLLQLEHEQVDSIAFFVNHEDDDISAMAFDLLTDAPEESRMFSKPKEIPPGYSEEQIIQLQQKELQRKEKDKVLELSQVTTAVVYEYLYQLTCDEMEQIFRRMMRLPATAHEQRRELLTQHQELNRKRLLICDVLKKSGIVIDPTKLSR